MDQTFAVGCPPFEVKLSFCDQLFPPTHSKRILCFQLNSDVNRQHVVDYLHIAFHNTIQRVPFLAGTVVTTSQDEGGRPWIRKIIPEGAAHLVIKDLSKDLSFSKLAESNFSQELLNTEQLCPLPEVGYFRASSVDVCRFQANFVEGGLLLVVSIIHYAADGRGVTEIIGDFAEEFRKAQSGETKHPLKVRDTVYYSDRNTVVSGRGLPGDISKHEAWTSSPSLAHSLIHNVKNSCRTFRIDTKAQSELKQIVSASSLGSEDWFSTNDAISGFIWRSIMLARNRAGILDAGAEIHVAQPLDCRSHLGITEQFYGNAVYMSQASEQYSVMADPENGLASASRAIRAQIRSMTGEKFQDLVGYIERTILESPTRMKILESMHTSGIILTSLLKFNLHSINFGPLFGDGHIKALRLPATGTQAGAVIIMPKLSDGSCEFMLTETSETMECLMEDPFFCRFTGGESLARESMANPQSNSSQPSLETIPADNTNGTASAVEVEIEQIPKVESTQRETNGVAHESIAAIANGVTEIVANEGLAQGKVVHEDAAVGTRPSLPSHALNSVVKRLHDLELGQIVVVKTTSTLVISTVQAPHIGNIKIIELQRPQARNAISRQLLKDLSQEIEEIHTDAGKAETRALVLASAVDGVFCAGADLKERKLMSPAETEEFLTDLRALFTRLATLPVPSIACVSGKALGGGFELALCCHLRIFSSDAVVALPETRLAIIPGAGGTYRLSKIVGMSHALDLILTGRQVQAQEAAAMGLCNRLVTTDIANNILTASLKRALTLNASLVLAKEIASGGPVAAMAVISAFSHTCASCEQNENAAYESVLGTKDRTEALQAFSEKRTAVFTGA
ncbi:hypothetical protein JX265_012303 [Neoarthrinium moseri]|uniref:Uncharacterized protein n=1 Tax=Neoarthrinium moseri TaxID=1658444 RepID=A0A9P9WAJ9_9PEZI|nr:hypothetical protein JX266_003359 [Neoarthrinium moseri]KAI1855115.1 hypothetical protein JX265_012303 [Neoarthrinium moseri]